MQKLCSKQCRSHTTRYQCGPNSFAISYYWPRCNCLPYSGSHALSVDLTQTDPIVCEHTHTVCSNTHIQAISRLHTQRHTHGRTPARTPAGTHTRKHEEKTRKCVRVCYMCYVVCVCLCGISDTFCLSQFGLLLLSIVYSYSFILSFFCPLVFCLKKWNQTFDAKQN